MFNFLRKIFPKTIDSTIYTDSDNYRSMIIDLNLDNPNEIIAKNVDHKIISMYYKDIVRVSIIVDGNDYLPQLRWTVQTASDVIHISNDLPNADKLFFEILNTKLDGYSSDETQQKILEAQTCVGDGFFHIWQRFDADEIFKSID